MKKELSTAIAAILGVVGPSSFAIAETNSQQDNKEAELMVVTATKTQKALVDAPVSISVVTAEDIERSGAMTVADMLKDVPGVDLHTNSHVGMKRVRIRGNSAGRTLIMVDGQRMTDQASPDGIPLLVDPASIERMEVVKGPSSVLYGSDAMGGVVNIITKKGGDKPLEGDISTRYSTNSQGLESRFSLGGSKMVCITECRDSMLTSLSKSRSLTTLRPTRR